MGNPYGLSDEQYAKAKADKLESEITNTELRFAVEGKGFPKIVLKGREHQFHIELHTKRGFAKTLVNSKTRKARLFTDPRIAFRILKDAGVEEITVTLWGWHPEMAEEWAPKRPDVSSRLSEAHQLRRDSRN